MFIDQLQICSSVPMAFGRRQPPRLVNLRSFGLVVSLVNTLPKWPPYTTGNPQMSPVATGLCLSDKKQVCEIFALSLDVPPYTAEKIWTSR